MYGRRFFLFARFSKQLTAVFRIALNGMEMEMKRKTKTRFAGR